MKNEFLLKFVKKIVASLAILLMMCPYFPAISSIVEATETKKEINIPDEKFKEYLLREYDADGDKIITDYDMQQIYNMNIIGDIKNVEGLENAKNIEKLSISSAYENIEVINQLKNLKFLELSSSNLSDLSRFNVLKNLTTLSINSSYNERNRLSVYRNTNKSRTIVNL